MTGLPREDLFRYDEGGQGGLLQAVCGADLQSLRAMVWLAGWLVGCLTAGTVRVTRSGLVVIRRPLVRAAGVVLHSQARVTLRGDLVCRAGGTVYGETASPTHGEACGQ